MLRSSLEFSGREYVVIDVPSGEEALKELERGPIDLLVTDLKLPGLSGLELVEKSRELNPNARSIVITGHPTDEAREKAEELGVVAFMPKPIRTSYFLEAVERALVLSEDTNSPIKVFDDLMHRLIDRLTQMQGDLGAEAILLLDDRGRILARSDQGIDLNLETALPALVTAFRSGLKVSGMLESLLPTNFQYFDGNTHDIYLTNVGAFYGLLIIYRGKQEPGQMGTVVHYGRAAVGDLLDHLSLMGAAMPSRMGDTEEAWESEPVTAEEEEESIDLEAVAQESEDLDADEFWEDAVSKTDQQPHIDGEALTYEQAQKLGLLTKDQEDEARRAGRK
jgi:CheY-like chemotaxis protein